jgi:hypothetical protein
MTAARCGISSSTSRARRRGDVEAAAVDRRKQRSSQPGEGVESRCRSQGNSPRSKHQASSTPGEKEQDDW